MISESAVKLEEVACNLCGGSRYNIVVKSCDIKQRCGREYDVVKCDSCGLSFLNPRPTKESMGLYYVEDDPEKSRRKPLFYERAYFGLWRRIPHVSRGSLLDIGCGSGRYIYTLREMGWDVKGVDVGYTEYGRNELGLDIREGDLADAGFRPESFDAITLWWSLEHMHDPVSVLSYSYSLLKKGGVLIAGVHNIDSLEARVFKRHWFHLYLPKHLYHFTPSSLTAAMKRAGFDRIDIRHDLFSFGTIGSMQCYLNSRGVEVSFTTPLLYVLSLPLDALLAMFRTSGLITAYAFKN